MKMKLLSILLLFIISISLVNAQVGINTEDPNKFTELDITNLVIAGDTIPKGVMIPRMSTAKRDLIKVNTDENLANGLFIYNTTENCYNYYNKKVKAWQSMCGSYNDAVLKMSDCSGIEIYGNYFEGVSLGSDHYITINVTVTTPGMYSLIAKTTNGYFFQASGLFPNTGTYSIMLLGIGTPTTVGTNALTFLNNGMPVVDAGGSACNKSIIVSSSQVTYTIKCDKTVVNGKYTAGTSLDDSNTVTIPITPTRAGVASFNTTSNNGVYFSVNQQIDMSTTTLTMVGRGIPVNGGSYTYSYTTNGSNPTKCDFIVKFGTTLGTYENPATSCLQILTDDSGAADGEYFISSGTTPVKATLTLCDMTNGGYTLIESFSEYSYYGTGQAMGPNYAQIATLQSYSAQDAAKGMTEAQKGSDATVEYEMFRLPKAAMVSAAGGIVGNQYRVRIVEDYTKIKTNDDLWAKNNWFVYDFKSSTHDFLSPYWNNSIFDVSITAKVFGKDLTVKPASATTLIANFNNNPVSWTVGGIIGVWSLNTARLLSLSDGSVKPLDQPFTYISSNSATVSANFNQLNDISYPYSGGEQQINHHFGKCGNATADDYAGTAICFNTWTERSPHRFNMKNGHYEGRYLQWFVK